MTIVAVIAGILAGIASFLPLYAGLRRARTMDAQSQAAGYLAPLLLPVGGSVVILAVCTVLCVVVARAMALPFVLAEGGTLVVAAIGFGIARAVRK